MLNYIFIYIYIIKHEKLIWTEITIEQKLNHKCAMIHSQVWIYLTRIIISSAERKVYPLHFSLSVRLNRSWGHHLAVMPVGITEWLAEIGIFHTRFSRISKSRSALLLCDYCTIVFHFVCCMVLTLFICGDVELNPGPKNIRSYYFSHSHVLTGISTVLLLITFLNYH